MYFIWHSAILVFSIADYFLEAFMANTLKLPVGIENFEEIRKLVSIILTRQGLLSSSYRDGER